MPTRDRAAADGRERVQPGRAVDARARRASGSSCPSTGKHYGLKQNFWFDSRRDVIAATDRRARLPAEAPRRSSATGSWRSPRYNWGEGNVAPGDRAATSKAGLPTDYASLTMPDETRNYLPKLQAVKNIVRDPEKYGLELADIPDAPYFAVVRTSRKIDVKRAAELAEMSVDEFQYLNPHHNRPVIAGADEYTILLPIDKAELFAAKLELTDQPLVSWQAYRMQPGETLAQVAGEVRDVGRDAARGQRHRREVEGAAPGTRCWCRRSAPTPQAEAALRHAVFTTVPQGRTFYYRVQRGDTLPAIAARYGVTAQELRGWNALARRRASRPGSSCASPATRRRTPVAASATSARRGRRRRPRARRSRAAQRRRNRQRRGSGGAARPGGQRASAAAGDDTRQGKGAVGRGRCGDAAAALTRASRAAGAGSARRPAPRKENRRRVRASPVLRPPRCIGANFRSRQATTSWRPSSSGRPSASAAAFFATFLAAFFFAAFLSAAFFATFLAAFLAAFRLAAPSWRPSSSRPS